MSNKPPIRPDESLLLMQELDDRLKEHVDKLEHIRLAAIQLKESLCGSHCDLPQSISSHLEWLDHITGRTETLHLSTTVFVQMNPKPRAWSGRPGSRHHMGRRHLLDDAQSELGWSPVRTRRNSNAASEMSCNW
ncbi:uncharacterized protein ACB058_004344 [Synchiropus picturatus]